ncbi:Non-specific lipid transfer protein GPI-anchored 2 [Forsythia ovata]|uniref:Non-specific lipid transfer protein GPI-anchored 2 n=1 Tax=Forsythia ovata TaxID=205694 RepID=A0ABD1VF72_9LAMI
MAPSPESDICFNALFNLSDCLTFVEEGSNLSKPDKGCCPEFKNLLNTQPVCLCQLLGDPNKIGITIDTKKALKLPSACGVSTPPVSLCAAIGVPVGVLAPSEGPSSLNGPAANPAPGKDGNGSPRNLASTQHFLVGLAILIFTNHF